MCLLTLGGPLSLWLILGVWNHSLGKNDRRCSFSRSKKNKKILFIFQSHQKFLSCHWFLANQNSIFRFLTIWKPWRLSLRHKIHQSNEVVWKNNDFFLDLDCFWVKKVKSVIQPKAAASRQNKQPRQEQLSKARASREMVTSLSFSSCFCSWVDELINLTGKRSVVSYYFLKNKKNSHRGNKELKTLSDERPWGFVNIDWLLWRLCWAQEMDLWRIIP